MNVKMNNGNLIVRTPAGKALGIGSASARARSGDQVMRSKTEWTEERLQRLFDRYNRTYWHGKLPRYAVRVRKLDECVGICEYATQQIFVDIDAHLSDRKIRATVLHEMMHVAAPKSGLDGHGYKFWAQMEQLLRQGAPVEVGMPETPGLTILDDVVPRKFPLARKAMEKVEAARQRPILQLMKHRPVIQLTVDDILNDFEKAAWETTEKVAVFFIGNEHGLIDVEGKPKSRRAAAIIAKGRKVFRASRRLFRQNEKHQFHVTRSDLLQIKELQATANPDDGHAPAGPPEHVIAHVETDNKPAPI